MKRTLSLIAASALVALSFNSFAGGTHSGGHGHGSEESAIGEPGKASKVSRTINVDMADTMRFTPAAISVKQGETVKFVIKNSGQVKHEFSLGTDAELKEHYETMKKFPDMDLILLDGRSNTIYTILDKFQMLPENTAVMVGTPTS